MSHSPGNNTPDRDLPPLRIPGQRRKTSSSPFSPIDATSWGIHSVPTMLSDFKRHTSHGNIHLAPGMPGASPGGGLGSPGGGLKSGSSSVAGSRVASGVGLNLLGVTTTVNGSSGDKSSGLITDVSGGNTTGNGSAAGVSASSGHSGSGDLSGTGVSSGPGAFDITTGSRLGKENTELNGFGGFANTYFTHSHSHDGDHHHGFHSHDTHGFEMKSPSIGASHERIVPELTLASLSGSIPAFISLPTALLTISYIVTRLQKNGSTASTSTYTVASLVTGLVMLLAGLVSLLEKRTAVSSVTSLNKQRKSTLSLTMGILCLVLACTWLGAARVTVALMAALNVPGAVSAASIRLWNFKVIRPFILVIFVLFMYDLGYYSGDENHPFLTLLAGYITLIGASYSITRSDLDISRSVSLGGSFLLLVPTLFLIGVTLDIFVLAFITSGAIGVFLLAKRNIMPTRLNGLVGALIIVGISTFISELPHSKWDIVLAAATLFVPVSSVPVDINEADGDAISTGGNQSRFKTWGILDSILAHEDTRNIFYFLLLNFSFMLIQLLYSVLSHSLGLLSDSIHMFFDCLALLVGLVASILSKFPPSSRFPYGLGKVETVSGFTNGCLLIAISGGVITEALERISHPIELEKTSELLVVSILGLLVNLVGIVAFNHGHAHGHDHGHSHGHSHGHDHSHDDHTHNHSHDDHKHDHDHTHEHDHDHDHPSHHDHSHAHTHDHSHSHGHGHSHGHSHDNENMRGIFLHVLADTLGSVGVIVSTILTNITGWSGFDPLASIFIAVLIFLSSIPLVTASARTLMLSLGDSREYQLRDVLNDISITSGVSSYSVPKFWQDGSKVRGVLHVQYQKGANSTVVRDKVAAKLKENGIEDVFIQVEEEDSPCWCRAKN
ncbi:metal cation transporter MSC2 [Sugiyamaella lignohabitans]|uniref:Zinc transporter n=1 Tax=Sugiyamaella lignohabitans TaxID=796027 RepID=A0A167CEF0_9ASCO|nr:metal cation transporter MSC2 [Sugiyamaella lignohabitans]ANB11584.1 metal cation transporter MSC2 [Sugiyamaella lignohabitans]